MLSVTKTAVEDGYTQGDTVTYVVSLRNTGGNVLSNLTVSDDLGAYTYDGATVYPLTYVTGSTLYFVNGVLQPAPAVTAKTAAVLQPDRFL